VKTRTEIEARAATTRATLDRARGDVTTARLEYIAADQAWIDSGQKRANERRRDASDALERCETLAKRAEDANEAALVVLAQLDREDSLVQLELLRSKLAAHAETVGRYAAEAVSFDRTFAEQIVFPLAVEVRDAVATHRAIESLANDLRVPISALPVPDLASACLTVRRAISAARKQEDRDALTPLWTAEAPDAHSWQLRGATAAELEDIDRATSAARQQERDAAAFRTGFAAAAAQAKPAPITTPTTETPNADQ
jgi:hypothetical protein